MESMESPNKRLKLSPPRDFTANEDFVSLGQDDESGHNLENDGADIDIAQQAPENAPRGPRGNNVHNSHSRGTRYDPRQDPRHAKDRPKSKHALEGHEPWILVRTKFGRWFVHNTQTRESLWHTPKDVLVGVREFERWEAQQKEKDANAKWAEEQLKDMRGKSRAEDVNQAADAEVKAENGKRRRRSESLQREDEEAMMAELAAQAEEGEEEDAKAAAKAVQDMEPRGYLGEASDSEYEYIEVTDTEGEDHDEQDQEPNASAATADAMDVDREVPAEQSNEKDGPVEFGEDDIAYQLAAMGADYGLDADDYDAGYEDDGSGDRDDGDEDYGLTEEDAQILFREMLDDLHVSPYTPWEKLIADESGGSILHDDRYTVLTSTKARKDAWAAWSKDKAAQLREERANMEKQDPKIPYLDFLAEKASLKLYWPEFKRKFKKDSVMNERRFPEKDREKLYRDHISRLKLPESSRKADLITLLKSIPLSALNRDTRMESLPSQLLANLHYISLPSAARDRAIESHISSLPVAPVAGDGELSEEQRAAEEKKRAERRRREAALAERERRVEEERRQAEKERRKAGYELREGERELESAMRVQRKNLVD